MDLEVLRSQELPFWDPSDPRTPILRTPSDLGPLRSRVGTPNGPPQDPHMPPNGPLQPQWVLIGASWPK